MNAILVDSVIKTIDKSAFIVSGACDGCGINQFDSHGGKMPHRTYDPARHLQQMGVRVDYVEGLEEFGFFYRDERRVEIRAGLDPVMERSVLAHEAAHVEFGHEAQEGWCWEQKQERMASAMAGRRLIDFHHFIRLQTAGVSEKEMCKELGVARVILRAYLWLSAPAWQQELAA